MATWPSSGCVTKSSMRSFSILGCPQYRDQGFLIDCVLRETRTPILVMTARDSLSQRVALLQGGADDFMGKPFALEELVARIHALIRRSRGRASGVHTCGNLTFDQGQQLFVLAGTPLILSPREHAVLRLLVQRPSEPMSKQYILERLVTIETDLNPEAIEVIIHRLRRKIGEGSVQIITLRGLGYMLHDTGAGT